MNVYLNNTVSNNSISLQPDEFYSIKVVQKKENYKTLETIKNIKPVIKPITLYYYKDNIKNIVDNVTFSIEETDKVALIGVNGTGKSTLLKVIAGNENYQGDIIRKKDMTISYLPQNPDFDPNNSVIKQVYKLIDASEVNEYEIKAILNKFGITNYEQLIKELSGGQQKRIALAITLLKPCDLLILDEPTNHLDNEMIEYLEKYLIKFNKAILMVTHDRYFLERVTNKIMEIDRSKIYEYTANYSKFLDLKAQREEADLASQRKRKLFLKKELEWVRAGVQARTTKSKERLQRFEQLNNISDIQTINQVELINTASRLGKKTIELKDLSMCYDDHTLFNNFSYLFKRTDRIGILGINGCGKSTLLKIIAKELEPSSGSVTHGDTIKIGYFKQMNDGLDENMRVIDYIKQTSNDLKTLEGSFTAKQMCERFLFDSSLQHTYIARLSGGEKRRLYLLNILMQELQLPLLGFSLQLYLHKKKQHELYLQDFRLLLQNCLKLRQNQAFFHQGEAWPPQKKAEYVYSAQKTVSLKFSHDKLQKRHLDQQ